MNLQNQGKTRHLKVNWWVAGYKLQIGWAGVPIDVPIGLNRLNPTESNHASG
jgi:hypothetical protein